MVQMNGSYEIDVRNRSMCGWMKYIEVSNILYDKKIPLRSKGRFYLVDAQWQ